MYAVLILLGWSTTLIAAANMTHGTDLARALVEGQLYFTGRSHLLGLLGACAVTAALLPRLSRMLLLGRLFPWHYLANRVRHPWHEVVFDLLLAACLTLAAMTVGVMAAFGLVFVPAWVAFSLAGSWRGTLVWSAGLGVLAYGTSYVAALVFDQPYAPVLVAVLLLVAVVRFLSPRHQTAQPLF